MSAAMRHLRVPDRAELFAALLALVALNALSVRMASALAAGSFTQALTTLFGVSAIIWFALYALLVLGLRGPAGRGPDRLDLLVAGGLVLACLLPTHLPALGALLGGSVYLYWRSDKGEAARRVAVVALSLTGPLFWGALALRLLGPELLSFDAAMGALFAGYSHEGNLIIGPDSQASVLVRAGCSAFRDVTLVFVLAATLTQLFEVPLTRRLAGWVALAVVGTIIVNSIRIATLARWPEHFDYFHLGGGMVLFGYASLLLIAGILGLAVMRAQRHAV